MESAYPKAYFQQAQATTKVAAGNDSEQYGVQHIKVFLPANGHRSTASITEATQDNCTSTRGKLLTLLNPKGFFEVIQP